MQTDKTETSSAQRVLALTFTLTLLVSAATLGGVALDAAVGTAAAASNGGGNATITSDNPSPIAPNQTISLNATSNYSSPTFNWSLGNGDSINATQNITTSYAEPGTKEVTLTVTNDSGERATANMTIEVQALTVTANANRTTVIPGADVQFNSTASNDTTAVDYTWTFGDGTGADTRNGTHSYDSPGTYTATVTAEDQNNNTATDNVTVTVLDLETNATVDDRTVIENETVEFTAQPSNVTDSAALTHNWTFESGGEKTGETVLRTYDTTGTYNVTLNTTDQYGNNATDNVTVEVRDPGEIKFVYVDGTSNNVTFVTEDGTNLETNRSADIVGPMAHLDDDGRLEAPYVDSQGSIYAIDRTSERQFIADQTYDAKTKLGVGDWTGDGTPEVLYANTSDNDYLYYANTSGTPTKIANKSADAVLGAVDFDRNGQKDVVYVGTSQELKYYNGTDTTATGYDQFGIQSSTSISAGAPADFYDNGTYWVPTLDTSSQPELVNANGTVHQLNTDSQEKSPAAGVNWTGDAQLELLHLKSSNIKYTLLNGTTKTVNDADGNSMDALESAGVAGVANVSDTDLLIEAVNASATGEQNVTVNVTTNEDLTALEVGLRGPESTTLGLNDFTETAQDPYTYTATYNGSSVGTYTATVERAESADGDVITDGSSDTAETSGDLGPAVDDVTVTDGDGNGLVGPDEEMTVTVDVSGDVDSVTADLSAFGAGEATWSPDLAGGEETLTETVTTDASAANDDGAYSVSVTAKDAEDNTDNGTSGDLTLDTTVGSVDAGANATVDEGETLSVDATASDPNGISSYNWYFGDDSTSTGHSVSHTYDDPGTYTVTLEVIDDAGNAENDTLTVNVEDTSSSDTGGSDDGGSDDSGSDDDSSYSPPSGDDSDDTSTPEPTETATPTETPSSDDADDTQTPEPTETATPSETPSDDDSNDTPTPEPTETVTTTENPTDTTTTSTPGFGVSVAVLALLSAALLARRE